MDHQTAQAIDARAREILTFERTWWKQGGSKEKAVRDRFGMSATRYYQILNQIIDSPAALTEDPMLVRRLRRQRVSRQKLRAARRMGLPE